MAGGWPGCAASAPASRPEARSQKGREVGAKEKSLGAKREGDVKLAQAG